MESFSTGRSIITPSCGKNCQEKGRVFQTDHSDTEVLLHGYLEWGEALVDRLNGMWAFCDLGYFQAQAFS